jgi:hypothetical protein
MFNILQRLSLMVYNIIKLDYSMENIFIQELTKITAKRWDSYFTMVHAIDNTRPYLIEF